MALNFKTQRAEAAPTTAAKLTGSGPLAAALHGPATARAAINIAGNPAGTVAQDAAPTTDMPTSISSTDLLLSAVDGTASAVRGSSGTTDSGGTTNSVAVTGNGVASELGIAWTGNVSSITPDSAGKEPNGSADGHSKSTSVEATAAPAATPGIPAMGNMVTAHTGTSAAMSLGPSNGPSNAGGGQSSLTPVATFAAMDRADAGANQFLLHAAPNQVAVGVADPGLGWIEVRAERVAGQVTAALTTNSTASHAELTSVLPAMSSYLHDQRQAVQQIHVETGFSGQNPAGGQTNSSGYQHRGGREPESLEAIAGIDAGLRSASAPGSQRDHPVVETNPRRSTAEGHQFSVRA